MRIFSARKHHLNQQSAARIHRLPTLAQDCKALLFAPVMDDMREKIGIPAVRNALEEYSRPLSATCSRKTARLNQRGSIANDMRKIKRMPRASDTMGRIVVNR